MLQTSSYRQYNVLWRNYSLHLLFQLSSAQDGRAAGRYRYEFHLKKISTTLRLRFKKGKKCCTSALELTHNSRLKIHENRSRNMLSSTSLAEKCIERVVTYS